MATAIPFFWRYGMHDNLTLILNWVLIFMVVFYVYPLKFLFSSMMIEGAYNVRAQDFVLLIIVYNGGISAICFIFVAIYLNTHAKRKELKLTAIQVFETKSHIYAHLIPASVALLIVIFASLAAKYANTGMAGWALMGFMGLYDSMRNKLFKKKFGNLAMAELALAEE